MEKFRVVKDIDGKLQLLFNSLYPEECCDYAIANDIRRVSLFPGVYTHTDLEPLMPLKDFVDGLILKEGVNFGQLYHFRKLKSLGALDNKKDILDLKCFPDLEVLACNVTERLLGLEACKNLKHINISNYNPKSGDLTQLPAVKSLQKLFLIVTGITNLKGVERFKKMEKFQIWCGTKLESIAALKALADNLKEVEIEKCKKINDFEVLGKISALETLRLSESGEIKNLSFVKSLPKLKFISFWDTKVLDGDISWCEGIPFVGFDNKRHYSHKSEEFKK